MHASLFLDKNVSQFVIRYQEPGQASVKARPKAISVSSEIDLKSKNKIRRGGQGKGLSIDKLPKKLE